MSRTRTNGRLSEIEERVVAAAEADLDRLLSIEPSPEFAAKVRARISEPEAARGWRWGRIGLSLASAAALLMALTLRSGPVERDRAETPAGPPRQDIVLSVTTSVPVVRGSKPASLHVQPVARGHETVRPVEHQRAAGPEVLIDASLADAIRRLALSTRNIPLDEMTPDASPPPVSDTAVPSVVVEPLTVPELVLKPADTIGGW